MKVAGECEAIGILLVVSRRWPKNTANYKKTRSSTTFISFLSDWRKDEK